MRRSREDRADIIARRVLYALVWFTLGGLLAVVYMAWTCIPPLPSTEPQAPVTHVESVNNR